MARPLIKNVGSVLVLVLLAIVEAKTPPGIANNPSHARCLIKKYKMCYNLEHVCPKFCPDSCTVECVSCKPICSGGSTAPPPDTDVPPPSDHGSDGDGKSPPPSEGDDDGDQGKGKEHGKGSPPESSPPPKPSREYSPPPPTNPQIPPSSPPPTPSTPKPSTPPATPTPTPSPPTSPPPKSSPEYSPPLPTTPPSSLPPSPSTPRSSPPPETPTPSPSPPTSSPPQSSPSPSPPASTPSPSLTPTTPPPQVIRAPPPETPAPEASPHPSDLLPPPPPPPPIVPVTPSPSSPTPPPVSTPPTSPTPSTPPPTTSPPPHAPYSPPQSPGDSSVAPVRRKRCRNKNFPQCYGVQHVCPSSCPNTCEVDCVTCKPVCKCDMPGAICQDPRFIGGDGITFYFHGKKDKDFCLVTEPNFQINAHFIGRRNDNMKRDFTWVQSIGILFGDHQLFVGAQKTATWNDVIDRFSLAFDGESIVLSSGEGSTWNSADLPTATIKRDSDTNSVIIEVDRLFKISAKVVPITKHESEVHNYGITEDDCFAHLELGFKFYSLSGSVNGVLGQTYSDNYVSRAKMRVSMPVLGGEKEFAVSNIFATDCSVSQFNAGKLSPESNPGSVLELPTMKCGSEVNGRGVVCKK